MSSGVMKTDRKVLATILVSAFNQEPTKLVKAAEECLSLIPEGQGIWQAESAGLLPEHPKFNGKGALACSLSRLSSVVRQL